MNTTSSSYENETRRLLTDAKTKLRLAEEEVKKSKMAVDAYEAALRVYLISKGKYKEDEPYWIKLLENQTHKEKLKIIAKNQDGKIRLNQATDLLYSNGFIKSKKRANAYIIIQNYLAEMVEDGVFEKVGRGEYRLKGIK